MLAPEYHERDYAVNTNVMQPGGAITNVSTIGERVKVARKARGITQAKLAQLAGVSQSMIGNLESGLREKPRELLPIAMALGVNLNWLVNDKGPMDLASGDGQREPIDLDGNAEYPAIRRVRFKLSAGASGYALDYLDEEGAPIVFQREWFDSRGYDPAKLFAVKVINHSMEPGLHDGDVVVVNTGDTELRDGRVFAMNYEGELVIKRMIRDGGQWWLASDNPDQRKYPRKVCSEDVHCIGRIVHKQSEEL